MFDQYARLVIVLVFGMAMSAKATPFTFTAAAEGGSTGVWATPGNWIPSGPPSSGDAVTIPDGKTCRVANANQSATSFVVEDGGNLKLVGRSLTITDDSRIDTYGIFFFETSGGNDGELIIGADLTISGDPNHSGDPAGVFEAHNSNKGIVSTSGGYTLTLDGLKNHGPYFRGSFDVQVSLVMNGGQFVADIGEVVNLGHQGANDPSITYVSDGAQFDIYGELHIGKVTFPTSTGEAADFNTLFAGTPSGTIEIMDVCSGCADIRGLFWVVSGGTLDVNADLCTPDTLTFLNGNIDVADGVSASFASTCP